MSAPDPSETSPPSLQPQWKAVGAIDPAESDRAAGLPQDEPLTPELLEDEAIRGDFMLRWAVVLLAFLLGCTEVGDTQTLVHVKTGQYLLSHGVLPPRTDVFSSTAADRPWINLAWLFDIVLAVAPQSVQDDANVIALAMWRTSFGGVSDFGLGSAIAVFLFLLVIPILALNISRFRREV